MKYEVAREKTFKKLGIFYSPSKAWKLADSHKLSKISPSINHPGSNEQEYISRLNLSHESNSRLRKLIEDLFGLFETFTRNSIIVMQGARLPSHPQTLKAQDLGQAMVRDLEKFREIDEQEEKMLEVYANEYLILEKEMNFLLGDLQDKLISYESFIENLKRNEKDSKTNEKNENDEERLKELLETCHDYSEQIQVLKDKLEKFQINDKNQLGIEKHSSYHLEIIEKLEDKVHELTKDISARDKRIERLVETVQDFEEKNLQLEQELEQAYRSTDDKYKDEVNILESQVVELNRILGVKNEDLEETLDNLRYLQEELAVYKYQKDSKPVASSPNTKDLKSSNSQLKLELSQCKTQCSEYKEEIKSLKALCTHLKEIESQSIAHKTLSQIKDMIQSISSIYNPSATQDQQWSSDDFSQIFEDIQYLKSLLLKMSTDNDWLVDQLENLSYENFKLQKASNLHLDSSSPEFFESFSIKDSNSRLSYKHLV